MCNMYMMTYSELPVFMTCGGGQSWYQVDGPGGIPPGTSMAPESPAVWRPPPSVGAIAIGGDELAFGQVAGAFQKHLRRSTATVCDHVKHERVTVHATSFMSIAVQWVSQICFESQPLMQRGDTVQAWRTAWTGRRCG